MSDDQETNSIDELVRMYVSLRDKKAQLEGQLKEKTSKINVAMSKIEKHIKDCADATGVKSFKTQHGTAFLHTSTFTHVENWDDVLAFVKENNAFHMLTKGVAKLAVKEYMYDNECPPPPGVNVTQRISVKVRRPS